MKYFILLLSLHLCAEDSPKTATGLPTLLDLGSTKCKQCKDLAPILASLTTEFAGRMQVQVVDVNANAAGMQLAQKWKIEMIPTQIFIDSQGRELRRHVGFITRKDILAQWENLGIVFAPISATSAAIQSSGKP